MRGRKYTPTPTSAHLPQNVVCTQFCHIVGSVGNSDITSLDGPSNRGKLAEYTLGFLSPPRHVLKALETSQEARTPLALTTDPYCEVCPYRSSSR